MGIIADTLKDAGHNVTVLSVVLRSKNRNVSYTKSVEDVVYIETNDAIDRPAEDVISVDFQKYWRQAGGLLDAIPSFLKFVAIYDPVMENVRRNKHVLDEIRKTRPKFDVILSETFVLFGPAIQEYLEIPVLLPVTSMSHDTKASGLLGEPVSPSFISGYLTPFGDKMNFYERVTNTVSFLLEKMFLNSPAWKTLQDPNKILQIETAFHRSPFFLINSNPYIDFARPMIPKTVQIGGITVDMKEMKTLDEKWSEILDRRPHNVLISFGSLFNSIDMPQDYKLNFVKVMKTFPNVTFIWKYESDDTAFADETDNIVFSKWFPQTALLADPRLSAFLTHAGLGSVHELGYFGKPSVLCPLFGDHFRNAKMLARHNGSIEISKFDLPKYDALRAAIQKILFDESYRRNAENLAKRLEKQPVKPKELLVKHAEFAAEFGEQPGLDCNIRNMSFIQYYLLDVFVLLASIAFFIILTLFFTAKWIWKIVARKEKKE